MEREPKAKAIRNLRWGLIAVSFWLFLGVITTFFVASSPTPSVQWIAKWVLFAALPLLLCTQIGNGRRATWFLSVFLLLFLIVVPGNLFSIHSIVSAGCIIALSTRVVREHFHMTKEN